MLFRSRPEHISAFLNSLQAGVRRQALRQECRQSLLALSHWCKKHWLNGLEQCIASDQPIAAELTPIAQRWETLLDFQLYRRRAAALSANELAVMAGLSGERSHWQSLPSDLLAEAIRVTIEREALLGWQAAAEAQEPALLLSRQDVDRRTKRLASQDARLLELNKRLTATPAAPDQVQARPR